MDKERELFDEIACVAYGLYEERGKAHGYALHDWLEAEKIVMERHAREIEKEAKAIKSARKKVTDAAKSIRPKTTVSRKKTTATAETKKKRTTVKKKTE